MIYFVAFLAFLAGGIVGAMTFGRWLKNALEKMTKQAAKDAELFHFMVAWMRFRQKGRNLSEGLVKKGYHHIAVYGMSFIGELLLQELSGTDVLVEYGIDQNAETIPTSTARTADGLHVPDVPLCTPTGELKPVDAVVVTSLAYFDEIEEQLAKRMDCPIIAVDDLLYM